MIFTEIKLLYIIIIIIIIIIDYYIYKRGVFCQISIHVLIVMFMIPFSFIFQGFKSLLPCFLFFLFFFLARGNYRILNETDRKNYYQTLKNVVRKCDGRLRRGWYRFMGAAGTKMPSQVVPISRCGTDATGWLSGSHPTVNQDAVRRRVCFHWAGRDRRRRKHDRSCMWSRYIRVLNCTTFLVYELIPIKRCHLRYCSASWS